MKDPKLWYPIRYAKFSTYNIQQKVEEDKVKDYVENQISLLPENGPTVNENNSNILTVATTAASNGDLVASTGIAIGELLFYASQFIRGTISKDQLKQKASSCVTTKGAAVGGSTLGGIIGGAIGACLGDAASGAVIGECIGAICAALGIAYIQKKERALVVRDEKKSMKELRREKFLRSCEILNIDSAKRYN